MAKKTVVACEAPESVEWGEMMEVKMKERKLNATERKNFRYESCD
jgi:hypothetical protein